MTGVGSPGSVVPVNGRRGRLVAALGVVVALGWGVHGWIGASARTPAAPTAYHEVWEVDRGPEFLFAPADIDELAERYGQRADVSVALRIDAAGSLVAFEVAPAEATGVAVDPSLVALLRESFAEVRFVPARRGGQAVPVVKRYALTIDPKAPVAPGVSPVN